MDDLTEAVARALCGWTPNVTSWNDVCDDPKDGPAIQAVYHFKAQAAIAVVLERCAQVAEDCACPEGVPAFDYDTACFDIATAIRAMGEREG